MVCSSQSVLYLGFGSLKSYLSLSCGSVSRKGVFIFEFETVGEPHGSWLTAHFTF